jgi:hypothetical protein
MLSDVQRRNGTCEEKTVAAPITAAQSLRR